MPRSGYYNRPEELDNMEESIVMKIMLADEGGMILTEEGRQASNHNDFIAKYIGNAVLDAMSQNAEVDATVQIKVIMGEKKCGSTQ